MREQGWRVCGCSMHELLWSPRIHRWTLRPSDCWSNCSVPIFNDVFGAECKCIPETGDFGSAETVCKDKSDFGGPGVAGEEGDEGSANSTNTAANSAISAVLFFFAATAQMFT